MSLLPSSLLPKSLSGRSLLIVVMPLVLVQTISVYVFFERHLDSVIQQAANVKAEEIGTILALLEKFPANSELVRREISRFELELKEVQKAAFPSTAPRSTAGRILDDALHRHINLPFTLKERKDFFLLRAATPRGFFEISLKKKRIANRTSDIFLMWSLGTSLLFAAVAWIFMRNQIRPIRRLAEAAEQFGKVSHFEPLKPSGALEVRKAGIAFNRMQERIKRYISQRTEMLAGVSHDLRAPMTRMRLQLELMMEDNNVLALQKDLSEMDAMVAHFLEYVREERMEVPERSALAPIVREVATRYFSKALTFDFLLDERIVLMLRPQAFRRILFNLLTNSQRYARHVRLTLTQTLRHVVLKIEDDGPGIPEEHRGNVLEPFFRLDFSRTPGRGGTGLGLPIVKDLVSSMNGDLSLFSSSLGGLGVCVTLPVNETFARKTDEQ